MCATRNRGLNGGIIVTYVGAVTVLLSGESLKLRFSLTYPDLDYTHVILCNSLAISSVVEL